MYLDNRADSGHPSQQHQMLIMVIMLTHCDFSPEESYIYTQCPAAYLRLEGHFLSVLRPIVQHKVLFCRGGFKKLTAREVRLLQK